MRSTNSSIQISELFKALSQPGRVEILLAIGSGEACVCHLEARLKLRQAYISQHLLALRQAGILAVLALTLCQVNKELQKKPAELKSPASD